MLIGFNLTFQPMMVLGLLGMPRRIQTYPDGYGWGFWNAMATVGAFTIARSILVFIINVIYSLRKGEIAGDDPWDARTLEWTIPSPPPPYNFAEIPQVHSLDDFWHRKYAEDPQRTPGARAGGRRRPRRRRTATTATAMATASTCRRLRYFPLIAALGLADHRASG